MSDYLHDLLKYTTRETCRVCPGKLAVVLDLGEQAVVDFPKIGEESERPVAPLTLAQCDQCGLVQLLHTVKPEYLYPTFWYRSGINESMRAALADVVRGALVHAEVREGDSWLDIGCNDGTMLGLIDFPCYRVGIDPAENVVELAQDKAETIICDYFNRDTVVAHTPPDYIIDGFKVITAIAMFYDLEEPHKFLDDIKALLAPDGVFIIQMNYLRSMMKLNAVDNVCHEHLEYYSLITLQSVLHQHSLVVVDVEENDVNGGSLRIYIRHKEAIPLCATSCADAPGLARTLALRLLEEEEQTNSPETLLKFGRRIELITGFLFDAIEKAPKPVYLYGASTRGTVLMQLLQLPSGLIAGAAERDPRKFGHEMVGTGIPIVSEEEARAKAKTFLVLPWHFWGGIWVREQAWTAAGGTWIKPLPDPRVISRDHDLGLKLLDTY
jgi:NDP-4-keto-2,6-dideoxyhexose 3-C-methyltransferase